MLSHHKIGTIRCLREQISQARAGITYISSDELPVFTGSQIKTMPSGANLLSFQCQELPVSPLGGDLS